MRRVLTNTRYIEMIASLLFPQYCLLIRHSCFRFVFRATFTADIIL